MQEKEVMEAAVRAFEDWEFRVLEQESGADEEDESAVDKGVGRVIEREMEKEISCQQHVVNTAQVKSIFQLCDVPQVCSLSLSACQCLPSQAHVGLTFTYTSCHSLWRVQSRWTENWIWRNPTKTNTREKNNLEYIYLKHS